MWTRAQKRLPALDLCRREESVPIDSSGGIRVIRPEELEWTTRPHEPGEAARHVAELSDLAGFAYARANIWRYEPGTPLQTVNHGDEELVVYAYGTPPEREHAEILDSAQ
jgi:hypothetical protein